MAKLGDIKMNYQEQDIINRIVKAVQKATKQQSEDMSIDIYDGSEYIRVSFVYHRSEK